MNVCDTFQTNERGFVSWAGQVPSLICNKDYVVYLPAKGQSYLHPLTTKSLRISSGLMPRNDATSFIRSLFAAQHEVPFRKIQILHETKIFRIAVEIRIVIRPEITVVIYFLLHFVDARELRGKRKLQSMVFGITGSWDSRG